MTNITLGEAKQYMSDNFVSYTIKKTSEIVFGLDVHDVKAIEEVPNINSRRRRNFRLYSEGIEDTALAWWEATQGPMSPPTSDPTFVNRLELYIKAKIEDNTIKFGYIVEISELTKKALCNVIMPDKTDKVLLVSEDGEGVFSFETLL